MLSKYSLKGVLLQCLLLNAIWAADINAQEVKSVNDVSLNLKVENASLSELFQVIEKSTNFYFSFSSEDISKDFTYTKNKRNITVRDVLLDVSEQAGLKFKQVNRNIIVQKNKSDNAKPEIEVVIQGITITGKVTSSEDNVGLPGANVIVKGTGTGTVTDIQGNYSLEVPDENATIVFSSVGYTTVEVLVGTQAVIDIAMNVDVTSLEEIVVVGYGTQKKITVTGAVVDVKGDELIKSPAIDMTNSIAGRLPGVVAIQTGGEPGYDGSDIKIRGTNTLGNADPLIVIDGIPDRDGGFGRLSPQDVESISVLKDASAAIYGSRAANGAIIITTKRGATGKPTVNFDMNFGWAQPVRVPEMSNAGEYARIMNELPIYQNVDVADWEAAWQSISTTGTYTYPDNTVLNANYHPDDIAIHEDGSDPWGH
ncbi:MAG: carboxypeptidase-like regulatory domain-containing protein, partial [Cyclobacteriaceae bacterium]|nr:carboxypeptidase-like regulatory domain-containing protein [Cyclobacteriaceae bacterium]